MIRAEPTAEKKLRAPRPATWSVVVLSFLLVIGFGRLYWSARSGSEEFATSIHTLAGRTVGLVLDPRTPAESSPDEQLDFWQSEIDRILTLHPNDAELHAAAAVILSEPSILYASQLIRDGDPSSAPNLFDLLKEARRRFDTEGSRQSLELIRRATELEPGDPRWWRLRAVLLWPSLLSSQEDQPFDPHWEQVLTDGKKHDPNNALYSLLHAYGTSDRAVDFDENLEFFIADPNAWQQTIDYAKESAASPQLTLGEPAMAGVKRLHELSRHPHATTIESIRARFVASRLIVPSADVIRNLMRIADSKELSGKFETRANLLSLAQQICDLTIDRSDKVLQYSALMQLRTWVWQAIQNLERERGEASAATMEQVEHAVRQESAYQVAAAEFQRQTRSSTGAFYAVAGTTALSLFASLLLVVLFSVGVWVVCSRSPASLRLCYWPFMLFAFATVLSLWFLGAGPAHLVPEPLQHWLFTGCLFIALVSLLTGLAIRSRLRVRFSIRTLLIGCGVAAAVLQLLLHAGLDWNSAGLPIQVDVASDSVFDFAYQQNPEKLNQWLPGPPWVSHLMFQWWIHHGPAWAVAIFFSFVLLAFIWCKDLRSIAGQLLISSAVLALLWLNAWVWLEPANRVGTRRVQMRHESYIRSIDEYYDPLEKLLTHPHVWRRTVDRRSPKDMESGSHYAQSDARERNALPSPDSMQNHPRPIFSTSPQA